MNELSPKERMAIPRQSMPAQAPEVRIRNFEEVNFGLTEEQALQEAARCLRPLLKGLPDKYAHPLAWADLEGLRVRLEDGHELGTVDRMLVTGANDVMVVQGDRQRLVPFVREQCVKRVDLEHGVVVVDWDPDF